ncbi:SUMO-activating enzyme subunit 1 isoform X1 [Bos indicus]|uniref:SUMO-activating enzyme subunit 1 n=3 Tax=Bos TaxID=9903 RepID=A0A3Q1LQS3_BOVIN|nr:SUMO-activating enzyme subunit 1 isoform X1 [Bos taurus]XP_019835179.1 PREDICTED: SUMO-activating enzyme subunit 1 isoform X1 [Bos indicus]XP_027371159.1 SUMO-activating enzyme subunit 1 isoform X1 [Bos indicus x Bos taurus]XP_061244762.1 SUMO-activating enzyme subunit 1 isoform X1 [Bos javanicus]
MVEKEEAGGGISEEEAAQYDRQIRLWGLEAQKRLRASQVLLVGMKGLGAEIAKNLILAGVKGLTMLDHEQVSPEDPGAQFLIRTGSVGRNRAEASLERAQNLNPMVDVKVDTENIEKKPESFFTQFDAVCLTCCSRDVIVKVDQICHKNSIKFFTGDVFGYHGYTFANLGEHEFVEEKTKVAKVSQGVEDGPDTKRAKLDSSETTMVKKKVVFCSVKEALEVDWSSDKAKAALKRTTPDYFLLQEFFLVLKTGVPLLRDFLPSLTIIQRALVLLKFRTDKGRDPSSDTFGEDSELLLQIRNDVLDALGVNPDLLPEDFVRYCFSEMAPVCAVVGGILAQEIVKALSQRDPPHNNFFFFDGMKGNGIVECLGPN